VSLKKCKRIFLGRKKLEKKIGKKIEMKKEKRKLIKERK
jgi:hypothetical protein